MLESPACLQWASDGLGWSMAQHSPSLAPGLSPLNGLSNLSIARHHDVMVVSHAPSRGQLAGVVLEALKASPHSAVRALRRGDLADELARLELFRWEDDGGAALP